MEPVRYQSLSARTKPKDNGKDTTKQEQVKNTSKQEQVKDPVDLLKPGEANKMHDGKDRPKRKRKPKKTAKEEAPASREGEPAESVPAMSAPSPQSPVSEASPSRLNPNAVVYRPAVSRPNPHAQLDDKAKQRLEYQQLSIRYKGSKRNGQVITLTVPIIDPDFPFELGGEGGVPLIIRLPEQYPSQARPTLTVDPAYRYIPPAMQARINGHLARASVRLPLGELMLRTLLNYFEKNLEWMLAEEDAPAVASSSAIKFIPAPPAEKPKAQEKASSPVISEESVIKKGWRDEEDEEEEDAQVRQVNAMLDRLATGSTHDEHGESFVDAAVVQSGEEAQFVKIEPVTSANTSGAIQMRLVGLQLQQVALLCPVTVDLSMRCDRCSALTTLSALRPYVDRIWNCSKCQRQTAGCWWMEPISGQAESAGEASIGYVRARGATPAALLAATIQLTCAACVPDEAMANQVRREGVRIGQRVVSSCRYCHTTMLAVWSSVGWLLMAPAGMAAKSRKETAATAAKLPTPIGTPLPDRGACKHYRKSLRWFRFPCCGKAYPCDSCHDEDAENKGHKAEWATRQICGLCSREMSISQAECACGARPAEQRRTAHWEGGKGTRDQNLMSKKDSKKYRNLTKTQAKKG